MVCHLRAYPCSVAWGCHRPGWGPIRSAPFGRQDRVNACCASQHTQPHFVSMLNHTVRQPAEFYNTYIPCKGSPDTLYASLMQRLDSIKLYATTKMTAERSPDGRQPCNIAKAACQANAQPLSSLLLTTDRHVMQHPVTPGNTR